MRTPQGRTSPSPLGSRAFSHLVEVAGVPEKGLALTIEPSPSDLPSIAEECGLSAVANLRARFKVLPRAGGRFEVTGTVSACVTQVCVVTLESFASDVAAEIEVTFAPAAAAMTDWLGPDTRQQRRDTRGARGGAERGRSVREPLQPVPSIPMNDETPDLPDPIVEGRIDLGAAALEFLVLALDPYPKRPGAMFADVVAGGDDAELSAFAALARLKDVP